MVDFEKTHVLIQSTYKNILENFNPGLKQLITTGKAVQKGLHNAASYTKTYLSCLYDVTKSAQACEGGANEIGNCLLQMSDAYNAINDQMVESIKHFHSELLIPLKAKQEGEFRHTQMILQKYMAAHKFHTARLVKAQFALAKVKKKSKPKQGFNKKEVQCAREVKDLNKTLEEFMVKNLRLALLEERKRYCFLFNKLSCVAQNNANSHLKAYELLTKDFKKWVHHCKNPHVLSNNSEHFIRELGFTDDAMLMGEEEGVKSEPVRRSTFSAGEIPSSFPQPASIVLTQQSQLQQLQQQLQQQQQPPMAASIAAASNQLRSNEDSIKYNTLSHLPRTALDVLDQLPEKNDEMRSALFQLKAVHAFKASNETQLSIEAGDVISVYDDVNQGGWIFGLNENTNRIGWFPFSYTQVAELESLKTLSERLANLEDVLVKRGSRSLQESPNFSDARYRKLMVNGEKGEGEGGVGSQGGSEYEHKSSTAEERNDLAEAEATLKRIRLQQQQLQQYQQQQVQQQQSQQQQQPQQLQAEDPRYETYSSIRLKNPAPAVPFTTTPKRSTSRISNHSYQQSTVGKTHRSLGALYSENLLRDLSHGPPPPPPPIE